MASNFNLAENAKLVEAITPQAGAAITGAYVSVRNAATAFVMVHINQAAANTVAITIQQATDAAGTGHKVITVNVPIWANQDCATNDTLVRQTDGVGFTTSAATTHKVVLFEIDPSTLDIANGFCYITVITGASAAGNITEAEYLLVGYRYQQATPVTAVT